MQSTLKTYYSLTKPGIIRGNIMTAAAGFLFASASMVAWGRLGWTVIGTALVIASACVINNIIDRDIDSKMDRTKKRGLVTGKISVKSANIYAVALGSLGFLILVLYVNVLTALLGLICLFCYVVIYGYAKRTTWHSTLIGSVVGGIPPAAGYAAATGRLDSAALWLFLILAAWQMPHFYAIAIFRRKEYAAANLPIISVKKGVVPTKFAIQLWLVAWFAVTMAFYFFGYVSVVYQLVMTVIFIYWVRYALKKPEQKDHIIWAKRVFGASLVVLLVFCTMISIDGWLFL